MNNPTQHRNWILGILERAAGAALALAIMLVPVVLATGSAQAQTYTFSVLYSFTGSSDGANPYVETLVLDSQGNLYGTTAFGGDLACNGGAGAGWFSSSMRPARRPCSTASPGLRTAQIPTQV